MVNVWIDEFTPCLKDSYSGDFVETEVVQITRKSYLSKFNVKTQWYVNWEDLIDEHEIYALVLKGTTDVQGLVALRRNDDYQAVYVAWMCASPQNNKEITDQPRYSGTGGHLFAICVDKAIEYGFDGVITGFAANEKLLDHYCLVFNAVPLRALHPYHFMIEEDTAKKIKEAYTYEWTDAKF